MVLKQFNDFLTFFSSIEHLKIDFLLPKVSFYQWKIDTYAMRELTFQYGSEGDGSIKNGKLHSDGNLIYIPLNGVHRANGIALKNGSILSFKPGDEFTIMAKGSHDWCNLFIPSKTIKSYLPKVVSPEKLIPSGIVELGPEKTLRMKQLLSQIFASVAVGGKTEKDSDLKSKIKKEVADLYKKVVDLDSEKPSGTVGRPVIDRQKIMESIRRKIGNHSLDNIFVEDLIKAAGVSGRTLRKIFMEYFGISPLRYLNLYRMYEAHAVLLNSDAATVSVSDIASQFGFWHFGRFASDYRHLFGERPFDTLTKNKA
jgi:AraC family ethanolamine operon transcriptional activator